MKKLSILALIYVALIGLSIVSCKQKADVWNPKPTWYQDKDGDGKGNPQVFVYSDVQPVGYVADNTDKNDNLPCEEALPFYADKDGDGLGDPNDVIMDCTPPPGYVDNADDNFDFAPIEYTPVDVPVPLIALNFDEGGDTIVHNTGSLADKYPEFGKSDPPSWSQNIPRSGGKYSVDFGTTFDQHYYVESPVIIPELSGLSQVTVTGWVNNELDETGSGGNRVVSWIVNGHDGFDIVYMKGGSLNVGINQWPDKSAAISGQKVTTNPLGSVSNWVFFAVTYDADDNGGTLKYYFGNNTTAASFDSEFPYPLGPIGPGIGHLAIGQFNQESVHYGNDRMFRGLIDQVKIYDKVLTPDQVVTVQLQNE